MAESTIKVLLDYVWVPIVTTVALLWVKLIGVDVRTQLLAQSCEAYRLQRIEDREWRDEQRREILDRIEKHHSIMTNNHDMVMSKLNEVDTRVKNGH